MAAFLKAQTDAYYVVVDALVASRRGHGLVARLGALVVLANLLPQGVVWHQRLDGGRSSQAGDGETLHPVQKVTTTDLAMNKSRVQLYRFRGNCPRLSKQIKGTMTFVTSESLPLE
jgi:hypothetical protein